MNEEIVFIIQSGPGIDSEFFSSITFFITIKGLPNNKTDAVQQINPKIKIEFSFSKPINEIPTERK